MLAVIGTRVRSICGGWANPTTPSTVCHQDGERVPSWSNDK